jgi:hypothetical protein
MSCSEDGPELLVMREIRIHSNAVNFGPLVP